MTTNLSSIRKTSSGSALDALLLGRYEEATRVGYGKVVAKSAAKTLLTEGRVAEALVILTSVMTRESALHEMAPTPTATVGDVLVCTWGYDQTNIDYYQVVAVSGSSVTIREIGKNYLPSQGSGYSDSVTPVVGAFVGEPMRKRVQKSGDGYCIKIESYAHAYLWDGKPHNQTASGYGH